MSEKSRISDVLLDTTALIIIGYHENDEVKNETGTGFFYAKPFELKDGVKGQYLCLITNTHVIKKADLITFYLKEKVKDGLKPYQIRLINKDVIFNENYDLCAIPVGGVIGGRENEGHQFQFKAFGENYILNAENYNKISAFEDIIFIGYPDGIIDQVNLTPLVRKGITSTPPRLDYNGHSQFLIDGGVFPGSSGSPVLIFDEGGYFSDGSLHIGSSRVILLGILTKRLRTKGVLKSREFETNIPGDEVDISSFMKKYPEWLNLGVVIKSYLIDEMIESAMKNEYGNNLI